jgi:hypothetical protein
MPDETTYEVGYGKPPRHTQFKKGQSGNPAGGRSRPVGLIEAAAKTLSRKISAMVEGKKRKVTIQEAILLGLVQKAIKGDHRASKLLLDYGFQAPQPPSQADLNSAASAKYMEELVKELDLEELELFRAFTIKMQEVEERRRRRREK